MSFYIGREPYQIHTHDKKTLFVHGLQDQDTIVNLMADYALTHVHLGINNSFDFDLPDQNRILEQWDLRILELQKWDYWITLEYDYKYHEIVLEYCWNEYPKFISLINFDLPYINQLNYYATLNITALNKSNFGIWAHPIHELQNKHNFIHWDKLNQMEEVHYEV